MKAGPLVALFASDDRHHGRINAQVAALAREGLRLLVTWPRVVGAACLLDLPLRFGLLRWIELGSGQADPFEPHHLGDMVGWMRPYTETGERDLVYIVPAMHLTEQQQAEVAAQRAQSAETRLRQSGEVNEA